MNKVVFVKAYFSPIGKNEVVKVATGEKKKGFLGGESDVMRDEKKWVQTGFSDCFIDTGRLTKDLQEVVERLNKEGYEVVNITNIISGNYSYKWESWGGPSSGGAGWGWSYTDGLMVVARKA